MLYRYYLRSNKMSITKNKRTKAILETEYAYRSFNMKYIKSITYLHLGSEYFFECILLNEVIEFSVFRRIWNPDYLIDNVRFELIEILNQKLKGMSFKPQRRSGGRLEIVKGGPQDPFGLLSEEEIENYKI
jgi:hypothetical protein